MVSWGNVQEGCIKVSGTIAEVFGRPVRVCEEEYGADSEFHFINISNDPLTQESGSFVKSMVSDLLNKLDGTEERAFQEKVIKECAATVYIGMYILTTPGRRRPT